MQNIPSVDLSDFLSGDETRKQKFINEIGKAYQEIGFVALKGHFLSDELVDNLYKEIYSVYEEYIFKTDFSELFLSELINSLSDSKIDEINKTWNNHNSNRDFFIIDEMERLIFEPENLYIPEN